VRGRPLAMFISEVSAALLLSVPVARADAPQNLSNCLGVAFSVLVPGETATDPPTYGEVTRDMAKDGTRDDGLTAATGALANCG
jgi:hypothetical protein